MTESHQDIDNITTNAHCENDRNARHPAQKRRKSAQAIKKDREQNFDNAERARAGSYCQSTAKVSFLRTQGEIVFPALKTELRSSSARSCRKSLARVRVSGNREN